MEVATLNPRAPRIDEDAGDVDRGEQVALVARHGDVEAGTYDEASHGEHADVVRLRGGGAEDGGVRPREGCRRADHYGGSAAAARGHEIDRAEVGGHASGGLERLGNELP